MKHKIAYVLIALGLVCIICAGGIEIYNFSESKNASRASCRMLEELDAYRRNSSENKQTADKNNNEEAHTAFKHPENPQQEGSQNCTPNEAENKTDSKSQHKDEAEIGSHSYIGELIIPDLDLRLPVLSAFSYKNLKLAPCRYSGSKDSYDLVIIAHNYNSHFGKLPTLKSGAEVYFCDMKNNTAAFEMAEMETLQPNQTEELKSSEYPLTLLTCNYSGRQRIALRFRPKNS